MKAMESGKMIATSQPLSVVHLEEAVSLALQ
jgi:hypothetical protein